MRPRERLLVGEGANLSSAELVALILGSGGSVGDAVSVAQRLLRDCGGLTALTTRRASDLLQTPGIGVARACALLAAVELGRRIEQACLPRGEVIGSQEQVVRFLRSHLRNLTQEVFWVLAIDSSRRLIDSYQVAQGGLSSVEVHPREVFRPLLREGAAAAIVAHNHPSGDPTPSQEDFDLTQRLLRAARLLGVSLLDHLIIGDPGYASLLSD